jgi:hypothetical protein
VRKRWIISWAQPRSDWISRSNHFWMFVYLNSNSGPTGGCSILLSSLYQKQQHGNHDDGSHAAVFGWIRLKQFEFEDPWVLTDIRSRSVFSRANS